MSPLLQATIFLGAAIALVPLGRRIGLAVVLGYLFTGVILGPSVLNVAGDVASIHHLAEYGVVLFLFLIGLELQPSRLNTLRRAIFFLGGLQVLLTGLVVMAGAYVLFKLPLDTSFIIGFGLALSSTAFALQLLTEKKQLNSTHGRKAFAILLFQDLAIIPILALMPLLSKSQNFHYPIINIAYLLLVVLSLVLVSRYVVRPFFRFVVTSGAPELLTASALFILFGVSLLMNKLNISMALGSFLTGVLLADSEYRHELEASIQPFKGLLLGLFFMSVGMSANIDLLVSRPIVILAATLALIIIKFILVVCVARLYRSEWGSSIRLGVTLAQGGEFAFVLFNSALKQQVLPLAIAEPLILVVTLSMALTPLLFLLLDTLVEPYLKTRQYKQPFDHIPDHEHPVIIAGFGRIGQIIGRVLTMHNIEFTAIDHSARQVDFVRKFGSHIYYGIASNPETLRSAGINQAKVFVLTLDDIEQSIKTAEYVARNYPHIRILARARDRQHAYRLREVGVTMIWRETFATSIKMAKSLLTELHIDPIYADRSLALFEAYDEHLLLKQQAIFTDERELIQSALSATIELESLFESDKQKFSDKREAPPS